MGKTTMGVSKNGMFAFEGILIFEMLASFLHFINVSTNTP